MRGASIGIIVVSYNDLHLSRKMYSSLLGSMPDEPFALVCADSGSTDGSVAYWQSKCSILGAHDVEILKLWGRKPQQLSSFAACLNLGFDYLLEECDYFVQVHPDMTFPNVGWAQALAKYLEENVDVGRAAAEQSLRAGRMVRPGNNPCMMWPKSTILALKEKDGYVYDEAYQAAGGYEDWDINRRIIDLGLKVMITQTAVIEHPGMGSRKWAGSNKHTVHNAQYYFKKWGTVQPPV